MPSPQRKRSSPAKTRPSLSPRKTKRGRRKLTSPLQGGDDAPALTLTRATKAKAKAKAGAKTVKATRAALNRAAAACSTTMPFDKYLACRKAAETAFIQASGGRPKPVARRLGTMAVKAHVYVYSTGQTVQVPAYAGAWTVWAVDEDHLSMGVRTMGLAILPPAVTQLPRFADGVAVGDLDVDDGMAIVANRPLSADAQDKLTDAYIGGKATAADVPGAYAVHTGWGDGSYPIRRHAKGSITVYFGGKGKQT